MSKRKLPLSMCGDNLYSFRCDEAHRNCNYFICQNTVYAYKEDRLKGFEDCRKAIESRSCPAIKMMLEEKKAGKALYYESYTTLMAEREKRQAEFHRSANNSSRRGIIATSKTGLNEDQIANREKALKERWEVEDDSAGTRIAKNRKARQAEAAPSMDSGNMFAEVVNELAKKEA